MSTIILHIVWRHPKSCGKHALVVSRNAWVSKQAFKTFPLNRRFMSVNVELPEDLENEEITLDTPSPPHPPHRRGTPMGNQCDLIVGGSEECTRADLLKGVQHYQKGKSWVRHVRPSCHPHLGNCIPIPTSGAPHPENTMGMPCTQCEVLNAGQYSDPTFGPF